jgi:DNA-binding CsgD family transcriptional regulator
MAELTARQRAIVALVAQGKTNEEIAERIGIPRRTVDTHVYKAMKILKAPNRAAAAVLAIHSQEIDLGEIVRAIRADD